MHAVSERRADSEVMGGVGWGIKETGKLACRKKFELAPKTVHRNTTANSQRKRVGASTAKLREAKRVIFPGVFVWNVSRGIMFLS